MDFPERVNGYGFTQRIRNIVVFNLKHKRLWLFFSLVILGIVGVTYACLIRPHLLSFPKTSEIESMNGQIIEVNLEVKSFEVPPTYFSKILEALIPAQRDWSPADWATLGRITIKCKGSRMLFIDLYRTGEVKGAFSLRPHREYSDSIISNYFRGGTEANIERVLREAYLASKSAKEEHFKDK